MSKEACDVLCTVNDEEFCGGRYAASVFWAVGNSVLSADERAAGLNGKVDFLSLYDDYATNERLVWFLLV